MVTCTGFEPMNVCVKGICVNRFTNRPNGGGYEIWTHDPLLAGQVFSHWTNPPWLPSSPTRALLLGHNFFCFLRLAALKLRRTITQLNVPYQLPRLHIELCTPFNGEPLFHNIQMVAELGFEPRTFRLWA